MITQEKGDIKERIDTNKDYIVNINEINDFIFDSKEGTNNLNELGNYLNGLSILQNNTDIIKRALMGYFLSKEWSDESKKIGDKVKANQPLEKRELTLLYLQMIEVYSRTGNKYQGNFDPNKPASGELLTFIKRQYNHPTYNPQTPKSDAQKFQHNQRKDKLGLYTKETPTNIEIPQIPELNESNKDYVYNYCYKLINWAEQNFPNDVANIRYNARAEHYDQSKEDLPEFARYDILLFAYKKYCESITSKHENLIKQAGYRDHEEFSADMKELQQFWGRISEKYPNLEETFTVLQKFGQEIENNKYKYFKNDEEIEKAGKNSEEFNQFLETKAKEYKIDEVKASFEKDPETSEEAQKYCEGINKIIEYQEEVSEKSKSYGDSIEKYQKYMQGNLEISQKYPSINEHIERQKRYVHDIQQMGKKVDFEKYEKYNKLVKDSVIDKDLNNMSILGEVIMDPQDEHFPILGVKNAADEKQKKIDAFRDNLQSKSGTAYRLLTSLSGFINGFLSATVNVGTSLGYMILSLCGKDKAELDKRKKYRDDLDINLSSKQKESVYDQTTHSINLNRHNGITTVSSSIAQMLVLINGGGVMAEGLKGIGVAGGVASKAGLFGMSFITQVGQSYQEASDKGLKGGTAFSYSMLSATVQSALELVSPNEFLLGKGSGVTKELIRNLVKDGSKSSFIMLGKAFLKNIGMEIIEENVQEALQLSAGNLINMYADNKWGSELGADWSWKNFAQTAIITTLTTGITTGASYMLQMTNMNQEPTSKLFNEVINNESTYAAVMQMLDSALAGEIKIPGTDMASLQQLKIAFDSVNDVGSNLHEEWRNTRLKEDGTYDPRIKTTHDQTWIQEHDGQTEVDIANTTFENLPSDRQHENLEAAKVAESLLYEALARGEEITQEMIEDMSSKVHEEWLKRNTWAKGGELDVPYSQLPESEKVKDRNQVKLAIETTKNNLENSYFGGKSHKIFKGDTTKAESNSKLSDKTLNENNEKNKSKKLKQLGKEISKQYEQATGEKIELTDEQLLSVLDAHKQDGVLGELNTGQLKQKIDILSETITDPRVRRFLLEAGFCGSYADVLQTAQEFYQKNSGIINSSIDLVGESINNAYKSSKRQRKEYVIGEVVDIPRYDGSITHGAQIQSYDPRTGTYLVVRYQNGKYAEKYVSTEELDSVNESATETPEISQTIKGYSVGEEVNIIKKDSSIGKANITEFNELHGLYRTEWIENGKSKFYYFTKEELDNANPNHIEARAVELQETKESTNSRRSEMADVRRISDVIAIGDLHGEYVALKGNLEYAGLAKEINGHLQWTGGNKRVVFQGDILSDRGTDGLKIIKEIYQLRQQAQSQGGDINIIVGNHDDFMISYLTGRNGIHEDGINISIGDWAGGINNGQGRGILELARDFYTGKPHRLKNGLYDFKKILKNGHENILNNMRESPEGRIILEEICNMKLVLQIDDVLYCHTNPTQAMLQYLTNGNIQDNINMLNQKYQSYLRKVLLGEGGQTISTREFNEISDLFLNTDNRDIGGIENYADQLRNSGINMISHGHSGGGGKWNGQYVYDNNKTDINGLKIVDTDFSYGKHGKTGGKVHSISVIEQNGGNIIMGDNAHYIEQKGISTDHFGEIDTISTELKMLYKQDYRKLSNEQKQRIQELEKQMEREGILTARSTLIKSTKISMLSTSEPKDIFIPDFNNEAQLREAGFEKGPDGKWYNALHRDWFPNPLSENDVIYIYQRKDGKVSDSGFGPQHELSKLYVRSEDFNSGNMKFIDPAEMIPGKVISAKKCASGTFCILPVGTKIFTSEGIVEVKLGEIVNIKEGENSVHTTNISDILKLYKPDPLNPASIQLFDLINQYTKSEPNLTETEKVNFQNQIAETFNCINRGQKLCEVLGSNETTPKTLKEEYEIAAQIARDLDTRYISRIDVSNFNTALNQAREILKEIYQDESLTEEQRQAAVTAVMVRLLPKTNAHQHLKGSVPKDITIALAKQKGFSDGQIKAIEDSYSKGEQGYDDLNEFNVSYGAIGRPISTPSDYQFAISGILREAMKQGQLTTEIRCACDSLRDENGNYLSPEQGAEAIIQAIEKARAEFKEKGLEPPKTSFVFLSYRGRDRDGSLQGAVTQATEAVKAAIRHPDMKFGFDVAGPEDTGYGPSYFKDAINIIKQYNAKVESGEIIGEKIGITMHAGETPTFDGGRPGYQSIEEAIELGVDRIGHGVQAITNPKTMQKLKDSGITVEICGVCNIQSIPVNTQGLQEHPLNSFVDYGIPITLCTDNDAICGTNISKEYLQFLLTGHNNFMDWNAVKQSARDGIQSAFISEADKVDAFRILENRINQIQKLVDEFSKTPN